MKQYLSIKLTPISANIRIDGEPPISGYDKFVRLLDVGMHEIEISADDYESRKFTVIVNADKATEMHIKLAPKFGRLDIASTPSEAEVWINDVKVGTTPYKSGKLNAGTYIIKLCKDEYKALSKIIQVNKGDELKLDLSLEEASGSIAVDVHPHGAMVYIDDREVGTSPVNVHNIKRGHHKLKVVDSQGHILIEDIDIKGGITTLFNKEILQTALTDYTNCRIGDYFYSDGSFSHALSNNKQPVGIVFSLNTTEEEKARGWTHGQIVALRDCSERVSWAAGKQLINGYIHLDECTNDLKNQANTRGKGLFDRNGFLQTMRAKVDSPQSHPAFHACLNFKPKKNFFEKRSTADKFAMLPTDKTSGWYLPSAGQWADIIENLGNTKLQYSICGGFFCAGGIRRVKDLLDLSTACYWTSLPMSSNLAWVCDIGHLGVDFKYANNNNKCCVRPVAAF